MPLRDCPKCGDPLSVHGTCGSCGYGAPRKRPELHLAAAHKPADLSGQRRWTREEWLANQRACQPWIDKCKAILAAAEANHRGSAIPHVLSAGALQGISYDPEAIAEREAIQRELT